MSDWISILNLVILGEVLTLSPSQFVPDLSGHWAVSNTDDEPNFLRHSSTIDTDCHTGNGRCHQPTAASVHLHKVPSLPDSEPQFQSEGIPIPNAPLLDSEGDYGGELRGFIITSFFLRSLSSSCCDGPRATSWWLSHWLSRGCPRVGVSWVGVSRDLQGLGRGLGLQPGFFEGGEL